MRVLFSTCGSRGDVEPLVALAVRVAELGAEVRMCAPPDHVERLAEVGVPMVPLGRPVRKKARGSQPGHKIRGIADEVIAEQFDRIPAVAQGCDAVVAAGLLSVAVAVRSVAEKLGIRRYVYTIPTPIDRAGRDLHNQGAYEQFGDVLNRQRASIGLPPVENIFDYGYTDRPWLAADPVLAPLRPTDLDAVPTGAWILPDERPLPAELEAFLQAGPPPVYVGFGSVPGVVDAGRLAIQAIRAQGRRVILGRGWADLALPDDGDDCIAVSEVNFRLLFPRVAAVVHAGGAGITTVAARAGVPQVVVRTMVPYFADRVADLGIGVAMDGRALTVDALSAALVTVGSPETCARAKTVAGTIRTDGASVAAQLLLDAASRERPPVSV
jgi:UDP:flavonoid glycosyltransferase YjiC (YdhE family)